MANSKPNAKKEKDYSLFVDAKLYETDSKFLTGAEIKAVAGITPSYQLFLEEPGEEPDRPISDDERVEMKKGKNVRHFYSVPPATFGIR